MAPLLPTSTLLQRASRVFPLHPRQATVTVTAVPTAGTTSNSNSNSNDLSGGAIAGIVIGSIVGFLLLLWIIRSCSNIGAPPGDLGPPAGRPAWYDDVSGQRVSSGGRRHRHHSRSDYGGSRSPRRSSRRRSSVQPEMVVRRSRSRDVAQPSPVYVYKERRSRS
jgi:hypothetical protein